MGDSPLALSPYQCVLGLSFYIKAFSSLSLPLAIAILSVVINLVVIGLRHCCRSATVYIGAPASLQHESLGRKFKSFVKTGAFLSPVVFIFFLMYNSLATAAVTGEL